MSMVNASPEAPRAELLESLTLEIDRFARILDMTEALLHPILLQHDVPPTGNPPEEVPMTTYHNEILRLGRINNRAEEIRSRIRL